MMNFFPKDYQKKGSIFVADFGIKEGIATYRVNGHEEDLQTVVEEIKRIGGEFFEPPIIEKTVSRSVYTVLLKIQISNRGERLESEHDANANE
jgi:hypothetical protein